MKYLYKLMKLFFKYIFIYYANKNQCYKYSLKMYCLHIKLNYVTWILKGNK